jgi:AAA+ ATPase superfamily predicted ATPase
MNMFMMIVIMMITFIDRSKELSFLEERYRSHRAELIVMYGRRRVGKTFLLRRFLSGKKGVYFVVLRLGNILQEISEAIGEQFRELERKAEEFEWKKGERKEVYYIYSRSNFTFAPEENVKQVSLSEVCNQPCT